MSHNRISRIGGIGQCFLLRVVDLRHNRIKVADYLSHVLPLQGLVWWEHNFIAAFLSNYSLPSLPSAKLIGTVGSSSSRGERCGCIIHLLVHTAIPRKGISGRDAERV